jgi:hypothetical protein
MINKREKVAILARARATLVLLTATETQASAFGSYKKEWIRLDQTQKGA